MVVLQPAPSASGICRSGTAVLGHRRDDGGVAPAIVAGWVVDDSGIWRAWVGFAAALNLAIWRLNALTGSDYEAMPVHVILGASQGLYRSCASAGQSGSPAGCWQPGHRIGDRAARETNGHVVPLDATQPARSDAVSRQRLNCMDGWTGRSTVLARSCSSRRALDDRGGVGANPGGELDQRLCNGEGGGPGDVEQGGSIVLVSSAAVRTGLANHEAIAAAKAGVIGLRCWLPPPTHLGGSASTASLPGWCERR